LKETSTCLYDIFVDTPSLCRHPRYKPSKEKEALKVNCFETPLPGSVELSAAVEQYNLHGQNTLKKKSSLPPSPQTNPILKPNAPTESAVESLKPPPSLSPSPSPEPIPLGQQPPPVLTKKRKSNDAEKLQYLTMLQSRLHSVGIQPKSLGSDFLEYLYSIYGATLSFEWVTNSNIDSLQHDYRVRKLEEHLDTLGGKMALYEDELDAIFDRLQEGKYDFDWLTLDVLEAIIEEVSDRTRLGTASSEELFDIVRDAAGEVLSAKGVDESKLSDEDIDFLVATVESSRIPTTDLKNDLTFIQLIETIVAVTPEELGRRESELEARLMEYGYSLTDLDSLELQHVLRFGKVTFQVIDEDGKQKIVFIDLDKKAEDIDYDDDSDLIGRRRKGNDDDGEDL
jgi:hypothetical protein